MTALLALSLGLAADIPGQGYDEAWRAIASRYLEQVDPIEVVLGAAEAAEADIPWLVTHRRGRHVVLEAGGARLLRFRVSRSERDWVAADLILLEQSILSAHLPLPDDLDLEVTLLRGMVDPLDSHTLILADNAAVWADERYAGAFEGIGAQIGWRDDRFVVTRVYAGSGAERAGLLAGDAITAIDGESTAGMRTRHTLPRVRGETGTTVRLTVVRSERDAPLELVVERGPVTLPSVTWERIGEVGRITLTRFSANTPEAVGEALDELGRVRGVVLDLRGNPGGSLNAAVRIADRWLREGRIVSTHGRGGGPGPGLPAAIEAEDDGFEPDHALVVLVDGQSASASEILAGALAGNGRAVVIGHRSVGKGTVQEQLVLRAEPPITMRLTAAEFRLVGDQIVRNRGIAPDLVVHTLEPGAIPPTPPQHGVELVGPPVDDLPLRAAVAVLERTAGPSAEALHAAIDEVRQRLGAELDVAVAEAIRRNADVDWSACPPGPPPELGLTRSDGSVWVTARNPGPTDLCRVWTRLEGASTPWDGRAAVLGRIPAGEARRAAFPEPEHGHDDARVDPVSVATWLDRDEIARVTRLLPLPAGDPGAVAVRYHTLGDAEALEVGLEIDTAAPDVRASLILARAEGPEVLERGVPVRDGKATLHLRGHDRPLPWPMELELTDPIGTMFRTVIDLGPGAAGTLVPPRLEAVVPTLVRPGKLRVSATASDDGALAWVVGWWDDEKIAWWAPAGPEQAVELVVTARKGPHELTLVAEDDQGLRTGRTWHVEAGRLVPIPAEDPAPTAEAPTEPPF